MGIGKEAPNKFIISNNLEIFECSVNNDQDIVFTETMRLILEPLLNHSLVGSLSLSRILRLQKVSAQQLVLLYILITSHHIYSICICLCFFSSGKECLNFTSTELNFTSAQKYCEFLNWVAFPFNRPPHSPLINKPSKLKTQLCDWLMPSRTTHISIF